MHHKIYEYNSKVPNSDKNLIWNKVKNGESLVVIGIKSVLMLPFTKLKLIIMDEEHETTYKSRKHSKISLKTYIIFFYKKFNAKFVMGSATPSLEAYHAMKNNQIKNNNAKQILSKQNRRYKNNKYEKEPSTISSELLYSIQKV